MNIETPPLHQHQLAATCVRERPRLVRLCALLTGHAEVAEDLAQETLLEAWRGADTLRDPARLSPWLSGIARNVCRRWAQRQGKPLIDLDDAAEFPDGRDDVEIELERDELAILLDRALGLLPATTRDVLIARFIEECSHAEIAGRLGLSEGAVTVRVHRGKLALRRLLVGPELRAEAEAFGIVAADEEAWRQTRITCPFCGRHPLLMWQHGGELRYRCAGECIPDGTIVGGAPAPAAIGSLRSPKSILMRQLGDLHAQYGRVVIERESCCETCGHSLPVDHSLPGDWAELIGSDRGIHLRCPTCGAVNTATMWHLTLDRPEARRFWQRHPRMRALPVAEIEVLDRPALHSGFVSRDGTARLDVIVDRDTYDVLRIDGAIER